MRKLLVLGALASSLLALSSAQAGDRLFHVDRALLDNSYGVQSVLERIDAFAEGRCTSVGRTGLWMKSGAKECIASVRADLIDRIGDQRLAAAAHARYADNR